MQALHFFVGFVLVGCGSSSGSTKPTARSQPAPNHPGPPAYCESYRGCAKEHAFIAWQQERGAEPTDADLAPEVDADIERCQGIVRGLSAEQQAWLEAFTGCGGSCDVYRCLDNVPADASEPFQCALGDPPPEE